MSDSVFVTGAEDYMVEGVRTRLLDTIYKFIKLLGD